MYLGITLGESNNFKFLGFSGRKEFRKDLGMEKKPFYLKEEEFL